MPCIVTAPSKPPPPPRYRPSAHLLWHEACTCCFPRVARVGGIACAELMRGVFRRAFVLFTHLTDREPNPRRDRGTVRGVFQDAGVECSLALRCRVTARARKCLSHENFTFPVWEHAPCARPSLAGVAARFVVHVRATRYFTCPPRPASTPPPAPARRRHAPSRHAHAARTAVAARYSVLYRASLLTQLLYSHATT